MSFGSAGNVLGTKGVVVLVGADANGFVSRDTLLSM